MKPPNKIWLYRITHIENIQSIITNGIVAANHPNADPNFKRIGDSSLIDYRKDIAALDPPGGILRDYIPFYFGPRSPMLYQIATGWEDIPKIDQQEIIYLISSLEKIKEKNLQYFFCDGHARSNFSTYYSEDTDLEKLDWKAIYATDWKSNMEDLRRKEKKQSELLIKNQVPWSCIEYICVFNRAAKEDLHNILEKNDKSIPVRVSPDKLYYKL